MIAEDQEFSCAVDEIYFSPEHNRFKKLECIESSLCVSTTTNEEGYCIICLEPADLHTLKCKHNYCIKCLRSMFSARVWKLKKLSSNNGLKNFNADFGEKGFKCFVVYCEVKFETTFLKDILKRSEYQSLSSIVNSLKKVEFYVEAAQQEQSKLINLNFTDYISNSFEEKTEKTEKSQSMLLESQIEMLNKSNLKCNIDLSSLNLQIRKLSSNIEINQSSVKLSSKKGRRVYTGPTCCILECNYCFPGIQPWISPRSCNYCFSKCIFSFQKNKPYFCLSCLSYTCHNCREVIFANSRFQLCCTNQSQKLKFSNLSNYFSASMKPTDKLLKLIKDKKLLLEELVIKNPLIIVILRVIFMILYINHVLNKWLCMTKAGILKKGIKFIILVVIVTVFFIYLILIATIFV